MNKFKTVGKGWNGKSPKSGKEYIRLELQAELLNKVKPHDLEKIYVFPNTKKQLDDSDYSVCAVILEEL
jgi:hypothetical protein